MMDDLIAFGGYKRSKPSKKAGKGYARDGKHLLLSRNVLYLLIIIYYIALGGCWTEKQILPVFPTVCTVPKKIS